MDYEARKRIMKHRVTVEEESVEVSGEKYPEQIVTGENEKKSGLREREVPV
jgi:hypothetical protein